MRYKLEKDIQNDGEARITPFTSAGHDLQDYSPAILLDTHSSPWRVSRSLSSLSSFAQFLHSTRQGMDEWKEEETRGDGRCSIHTFLWSFANHSFGRLVSLVSLSTRPFPARLSLAHPSLRSSFLVSRATLPSLRSLAARAT